MLNFREFMGSPPLGRLEPVYYSLQDVLKKTSGWEADETKLRKAILDIEQDMLNRKFAPSEIIDYFNKGIAAYLSKNDSATGYNMIQGLLYSVSPMTVANPRRIVPQKMAPVEELIAKKPKLKPKRKKKTVSKAKSKFTRLKSLKFKKSNDLIR